ncbi:MAG: sensor histidine kinase [Myxococcota bacterium]
MMRDRVRIGIYAKINALVCVLVLTSAGVVALATYGSARTALLGQEFDELRLAARTASVRFRSEIDELHHTIRFLAEMPPVQGIIRTQRAGGTDPYDGSSEAEWRHRLGTSFMALVTAESKYLRVSYIGLAEYSREIVRVERNPLTGVVTSARDRDLRYRADSPDVLAAMTLMSGEVYYSPIELSHDGVRVIEPHRTAIRCAIPVFDEVGETFGVLLLEVDVGELLASLTARMPEGSELYVIDEYDQLLAHPDRSGSHTFGASEMHRVSAWKSMIEHFTRRPDGSRQGFVTDRRSGAKNALVIETIRLAPDGVGQSFSFLVSRTHTALGSLRARIVAIGCLLITLALLISWWVSRSLTEPLQAITRAIRAFSGDRISHELPLDDPSEAGILARAFNQMSEEVAERTEQLRDSEAALRDREGQIARKNRMLETLLHVSSHDLKEPLRSIESFSGLLLNRYGRDLDDKGQDYARRVVRAAQRMRTLLDDVRTLSQARQMGTDREALAGDELVAEVLEVLEHRIRDSRAQVTVADDLPEIRADRRWAVQALLNLVSNALKFVRDGRTPEVAIETYYPAPDDPIGLGFAVSDRGPGVDADQRERIFQLFQRAVGRDIEGNGAGLAIVREIAEQHGGAAWVEDRPGGGARFVVTFGRPLGARAATDSAAAAAEFVPDPGR